MREIMTIIATLFDEPGLIEVVVGLRMDAQYTFKYSMGCVEIYPFS
jgi:hypothetical protein